MTHVDLFAGIGGFSLAASWVWPDHAPLVFCEKDEYCQRVLARHWPNVPIHPDIRDLDGSLYRTGGSPAGKGPDLLTGSPPCQPFSSAARGRTRGKADNRHLWPEMLRVLSEARPRWVVFENVTGITNVVLSEVVSDLEGEGYEVAPPLEIPACALGFDHHRPRIWVCGHADEDSQPRVPLHAEASGVPGHRDDARSVGKTNGIPRRLDTPFRRMSHLGNAIVPQIAAAIFRAIKETGTLNKPLGNNTYIPKRSNQ